MGKTAKHNPFSFTVRQAEIIHWCEQNEEKYPELKAIFSIPAFNKSVRQRMPFRLQQQGYKKGMPGLFLPVHRGGFSGLFIECEQSKEQIHWKKEEKILFLLRQGFFHIFAGVTSSACNMIELYLAGKLVRKSRAQK